MFDLLKELFQIACDYVKEVLNNDDDNDGPPDLCPAC